MSDDEPSPMLGAMLALALGAGCAAPAGTIKASVGSELPETISGLTVEFVGAEADPNGGTITVARGGHEIARGGARAGSEMPVTLDGHPCALVSRGPFTYDDSGANHELRYREKVGQPNLTRRTYQRVGVELRCADGAVPGTPASFRGANPRRAMLWALPAALLGAVAGGFARSDRKGGEQIGAAFLLFIAAIAVAIGLAWTQLGGGYRLPMTLVCSGAAIGGVVAGRLWHRKKPHASLAWAAGALVGPLPIVLLSPGWSYSGPLVALACAAGAAIIASVVAVMIKPLV